MHTVHLSEEDGARLRAMIKKGEGKARVLNRARILLKLDQAVDDISIARDTFVSKKTVGRIRGRHREGGVNRALFDLPRPGQPPIITEKIEAHLIAIACSKAPEGRARWTLELLRGKLLADKKLAHISSVAIMKRLRKRGIKPWREKNVVRPQPHA